MNDPVQMAVSCAFTLDCVTQPVTYRAIVHCYAVNSGGSVPDNLCSEAYPIVSPTHVCHTGPCAVVLAHLRRRAIAHLHT